jgi:hypothetical protein
MLGQQWVPQRQVLVEHLPQQRQVLVGHLQDPQHLVP